MHEVCLTSASCDYTNQKVKSFPLKMQGHWAVSAQTGHAQFSLPSHLSPSDLPPLSNHISPWLSTGIIRLRAKIHMVLCFFGTSFLKALLLCKIYVMPLNSGSLRSKYQVKFYLYTPRCFWNGDTQCVSQWDKACTQAVLLHLGRIPSGSFHRQYASGNNRSPKGN